MMRVICLLLVSLFTLKVNAQQYTKFNGYGFQADRIKSDSISIHPSDTIRNKAARSIAVLNGVFYIADGTKWKVVGTDTTALSNRIDARVKYTDTATMLTPYSKLKSVGLSMPSAFTVANSPLTSNGTLAVSGAGTAAQYVRGDGTLATLPSGASGGSAVSYYLNGGTSQGTIGGSTYYQMSKTAVLGTGVDFSTTGNGLLTQFITDVADPNRLEIPAGNWNFEMYFNISSAGGNTAFYVELLKYNGSGFTSIASSSGTPEEITGGTAIDVYLTSLAIPYTTLTTSDRLAIRVYIVNNSLGRTVSLHTQNSHLCQIITNFAGGVSALNGLTANTQYFATGTSGTDFNISSVTDTHTFNLPTASATNRGALSSTDWSSFNGKVGGSGTSGQVAYWNGTSTQTGSNNLFWDNTNGRLGIGTNAPTESLDISNGNLQLSNSKSIRFKYNTGAAFTVLQMFSDNHTYLDGANDINFRVNAGATTAMITKKTGNILINTTTDAGYKLDVNGTARVSGQITADGTIVSNNATMMTNGSTGGVSITTTNNRIYINAGANVRVTDIGSISGTLNLRTNGTIQGGAVYSFANGLAGATSLGYTVNITGTNSTQTGGNVRILNLEPTLSTNNAISTFKGIYYNPTISGLLANTSHNAIETVTGNILLGTTSGSVGIGANTSINASAILDVTSTTKGFLPPRMTTDQRDLIATPAAGLIIYNTSTNKHQGYNGTTWNDFY